MKEFSLSYLKILKSDLKGLNLTRIVDPEEFYAKQILDSVLPFEQIKSLKNDLDKKKMLVDIGFGGGFPILPLAYKFSNDYKFIGIEARKKKVEAVRHIAKKLSLDNVQLFHHRYEKILFDFPAVIVFKAVGDIAKLLNLFSYTSNISVYFYKGPNLNKLEDLNIVQKNWKIIEDTLVEVSPSITRRLIGFSPKNVPRRTLDKNLVKLSSIYVS